MILVTGAAGFLGKSVIKNLSEKKPGEIRAFVRPNTPIDIFQSVLSESNYNKMDFFEGSFFNQTDLEKALEGVDVVLHLAASTGGSVPAQIANTVSGTENLLKACEKLKIKRFVLCSSLGVLKTSHLKRNEVVDEEIPIEDHPEYRDPYTHAKIVQENMVREYCQKSEIPLVIVRPGVIFGPPASLLSARIGLNIMGMFFHLGGGNILPITFKDNCAEAMALACLREGIEGQIFHVYDDNLPTSRQVLKKYKNEVRSIRSIRVPYFALMQLAKLNQWYSNRTNGFIPQVFTPYKVRSMWKSQRYSNKKSHSILGWNPVIPTVDALAVSIEYLKKNSG